MYNQVIVVEGKHDEQKIKSIYPDVETIVTNGSEISKETINLIYQTSFVREVILFMDPDFPGKQITNKILETNGNYKIAYLNKKNAISKNNKKVGIEHASEESIRESLDKLFTVSKDKKNISYNDLYIRGIINIKGSKTARKNLCKSLNIALFNGKALLRYLNMLNITLERVDEIIEKEQ